MLLLAPLMGAPVIFSSLSLSHFSSPSVNYNHYNTPFHLEHGESNKVQLEGMDLARGRAGEIQRFREMRPELQLQFDIARNVTSARFDLRLTIPEYQVTVKFTSTW